MQSRSHSEIQEIENNLDTYRCPCCHSDLLLHYISGALYCVANVSCGWHEFINPMLEPYPVITSIGENNSSLESGCNCGSERCTYKHSFNCRWNNYA